MTDGEGVGEADAAEASAGLPDRDGIADAVRGTRWGAVEVVESTGSTNADLMARVGEPGLAGTVRITTHQTQGRGRHTRVWETPPGRQVAISAAVGVTDHTERLGWLSLVAGMAAAGAIETVTGVRPTLKWPNDVLIDDRKTAGILSEYAPAPTGGIAVIGIGINTRMSADDLPVPTATSLLIATGAPVDHTALVAAYLRELSGWLDRWPDDVAGLAAAYRQRCDTIGRRVRLDLPDGSEVLGVASGVDDAGRIEVDADGRSVVASAADVTHLRSVD